MGIRKRKRDTDSEAAIISDAEGAGAPEGGEETLESAEPEKRSVKRIVANVLLITGVALVFFVGLMVLLYPSISNYVNLKNQSRAINTYRDNIRAISEVDYSAELQAARDYNAQLASSGMEVEDAFLHAIRDAEKTGAYWQLLDMGNLGMIGYVKIPSLSIELPIFHGTSEAVLAMGAGHVHGSSLPVGGESTHAALSAHTGLPQAKLFTGVDQLKLGDTFEIFVLNEELTYQIDSILTVLPEEVDTLQIVEGGDYVTLVTCTPYGINSHRLLIRGERIETPEKATEQSNTVEKQQSWLQRLFSSLISFLGDLVEQIAVWLVSVTEWGMDLLHVER